MDPIRKEVCEPVAAICLLVVVRYMHCSLKKVGVEKTFEAWLQMHQNFSGLFETLGEKHTGVRSPLHKTFDSRLSFVAIHTELLHHGTAQRNLWLWNQSPDVKNFLIF